MHRELYFSIRGVLGVVGVGGVGGFSCEGGSFLSEGGGGALHGGHQPCWGVFKNNNLM